MLVLTRKIDEQIVIGDNIKITVIKVRNNQVRIGISAPRDVRVLRGELEPNETEASESNDTQLVVDLDLEDEATQSLLKTTEEIETSYRPTAAKKPSPSAESVAKRPQPSAVERTTPIASAPNNASTNRVGHMLPSGNTSNRMTAAIDATDTASQKDASPELRVYSGKVSRRTGEGSLKRSPLANYFTAP
ncbi:carbon storage regulator [Rhodopirellula bahusiensis]|uniref:Translational regulator CsrA n=1 Tax=Rhodopirellula bahusiensis TaxID=2014065 RepID=A0A2G1W1W3_9BACT|nr:carbon storage regulator [Rhodopirellula bahusiensis]PHQ33014.1 carbon storage regulator [Rhodopirellula bahusiensis]